MTTQRCPGCKRDLGQDQYAPSRWGYKGTHCRDCRNARQKRRKQAKRAGNWVPGMPGPRPRSAGDDHGIDA
jgi:hypothetical protein